MLNIFNLFLFLLLLWIALMFSSGHVTLIYGIFGILSCALISVASWRLNFINKNSEFLYLSLGFYRHFLQIYSRNFFKSLKMIVRLALSDKPLRPLIYRIPFEYKNKFNPALFEATLNMSTGLFCIREKNENFLVHALDEAYFDKLDLHKLRKIFPEINDDNLV